MSGWREKVAEGSIRPRFSEGGVVPFCQESCGYYRGGLCVIVGKLGAMLLCEPAVIEMGLLLDEEQKARGGK